MGYKIERFCPAAISLVVAILTYTNGMTFFLIPNFLNILSPVVSISSIIVGFLTTMISVLIVLSDREVMKRIRRYNKWKDLTRYLFTPIVTGFVVAISSTLLNVCASLSDSRARILTALWIFFVSWFFTTTFRMLFILIKILQNVSEVSTSNVSIEIKEPNLDDAFRQADN